MPGPYPGRVSTPSGTRLAFVGQAVYFAQCALDAPGGGLEPHFLDFRHDADPGPLRAALEELDPDVIVVFRPEILPRGLLDGLRALTVGWLTEPLPRDAGDGAAHPDLAARLGYLRAADAENFDRVVSFDPLVAATADAVLPVWRSIPLPVADSLFADVVPVRGRPQALFVGRSSMHREEFLGPVKHDFDVLHLAHGATGERLRELLARADVALNLHNEAYPTFENRVPLHLAAGHLVLSEPLSPSHGLQPGIDYLEAATPWALWRLMRDVDALPDAFRAVRVHGRRAAERFRASRVYGRLVADLEADVGAFGSPRQNGRRSTISSSRGADASRSEASSVPAPGHSIPTAGSS